jgi:hypothetical protein
MLDYLVGSRARRALLLRLWAEGDRGSVSTLARLCGLSFNATHRELRAMEAAGLALAERQGAALEYRADRRHPQGQVLLALLTPPERQMTAPEAVIAAPPGTEGALVDSLVQSHQDESVALTLPAILWRQREQASHGRLVRESTRRNERQSLGLFLQLAGQLSGDRSLTLRGSFLRDRRRTALRPYFGPGASTSGAQPLPLARRWGYLLRLELERFAAAFRREMRHASRE